VTTKRYITSLSQNLIQVFWSKEFIVLTIIGNSIIFFFASILYHMEFGVNPKIQSYLDALWFSFSTVTTVGYGDVTPITTSGRILGISMMLMGTTFFVTFTALFSNAILSTKISIVEKEITSEDEKIEELINLLKNRKN
jgi:voltage-gated potassium channel